MRHTSFANSMKDSKRPSFRNSKLPDLPQAHDQRDAVGALQRGHARAEPYHCVCRFSGGQMETILAWDST